MPACTRATVFPSLFLLNKPCFEICQDLVWMTGSWLLKRFSFEPGLLLAGILIKSPPQNSHFLSLLPLVTPFLSYCTHTYTLTHVCFHILPPWMSHVHVREFFPADLMSPTKPETTPLLLACPGQCHCAVLPCL